MDQFGVEYLDSLHLIKQEDIEIKDEVEQERESSKAKKVTTYKCDQCDYQTVRRYLMEMHSLTHQKTMHKCDQYDFQTNKKNNLDLHFWSLITQKKKTASDIHSCDQCNNKTEHKHCLKMKVKMNFEKLIASKVKSKKVDKFGEEYLDSLNLIEQEEIEIKDEFEQDGDSSKVEKVTTYNCDKCEYRTLREFSLLRHSYVHTKPEVMMYRCGQCDYQTSLNFLLTDHHKIHQKPGKTFFLYKCDQCDLKTNRKRILERHRKTHLTQEKKSASVKYSCIQCNNGTVHNHCLKMKVKMNFEKLIASKAKEFSLS